MNNPNAMKLKAFFVSETMHLMSVSNQSQNLANGGNVQVLQSINSRTRAANSAIKVEISSLDLLQ